MCLLGNCIHTHSYTHSNTNTHVYTQSHLRTIITTTRLGLNTYVYSNCKYKYKYVNRHCLVGNNSHCSTTSVHVPLDKSSQTLSCTSQIIKLIFYDCNKNLTNCKVISCMQFIQFFYFQCQPVSLQLVLRMSFNTKVRCSLRQMIRHHAFKNNWIVNRIRGGMAQFVVVLPKAIEHFNIVPL